MNPFALMFISVMAFCHGYLFWNLRRAFGGGLWQYAAAAVIGACFAGVYFRSRIAWTGKYPALVDAIFLWIGFLLIVTIVTGTRDIMHVAALLCDRAAGTNWARHLATAASFLIALALGVAAYGYSLYEARAIRIRPVEIKTAKLPQTVDRVRIVALSDLHITRRTDPERLAAIAEMVNAQQPDIIVLLGDTADDYLAGEEALREALSRIRAPSGKFAVVGNHELFGGLDASLDFQRRAGFRILRGEGADAKGIRVVGVDDPRIGGRVTIPQVLAGEDKERFVLLLAHRPETPEEARGRFDLQLSGHTHGGQVWPMAFFTWFATGHWQGLSELPGPAPASGPSLLYLSNGTGQWGPPVRFLTPPEITVIDLVR